jgi:uncharacterized lipoprotein
MFQIRKMMIGLAAVCLLAGCETNSSGGKSTEISDGDVPTAVVAAFKSEHPYAEMNHPKTYTDNNHNTVYEIPYTRPDGTTGTARYGAMGELLMDMR